MSVAEHIGLPDAFRTTLLIVALLLALTPYLSGLAISGVQLPRLPHAQRRRFKILGPIAIAFAVALVFPIEALAPPSTRLQLLAADVTESGEIDLAIANDGTAAVLLTRMEIEVLDEHGTNVRPALIPSAHYRIAVGDLRRHQRRSVAIRHLIAPKTTERLVIAPETNRSTRIRISIYPARGTALTCILELWPFTLATPRSAPASRR
jgi:hypothetical protein